MYLCYLDESGTQELNTGTSHFVLHGLAIPAAEWKAKDFEITSIKKRFGLEREELHAGWMARRYVEQERIPEFQDMDWKQRLKAVEGERNNALIRTVALKSPKALKELKKNYRKTKPYIHLTRNERIQVLKESVERISSWGDCRLFAEAIDKTVFDGQRPNIPLFESAFTQVVSRFHSFLKNYSRFYDLNLYGLIIQDNNQTVSQRLTTLMREFHSKGTIWTDIERIIETPLFVDSHLTSMVQLSDICAYAIRRYLENNENGLFDIIFERADRVASTVVGFRHYVGRAKGCGCRICQEHSYPLGFKLKEE